jgi:hypothetical protein
MNEHLMKAIIRSAAFLELSGDDILNPDAAVRELESLSHDLQMLSPAERRELVDFALRYAEEEARMGQPQRRVEFIRSLPQALGFMD